MHIPLQQNQEEMKETIEQKNNPTPNLIFGLKGLAALLGVSYSTAYRIKRSKILQEATYQVNRCISFDANKVLEILKESNNIYNVKRRKR